MKTNEINTHVENKCVRNKEREREREGEGNPQNSTNYLQIPWLMMPDSFLSTGALFDKHLVKPFSLLSFDSLEACVVILFADNFGVKMMSLKR